MAVAVAGVIARIYGLGAQASWQAMGIAEYHGPRSQMMRVIDYTTMLKDGSGWGAMAGVSAVEMAALGFTGAPALIIRDEDCADDERCDQGVCEPISCEDDSDCNGGGCSNAGGGCGEICCERG